MYFLHISYTSGPYDQTSLSAPEQHVAPPVVPCWGWRGSRSPWSRITGQKVPHLQNLSLATDVHIFRTHGHRILKPANEKLPKSFVVWISPMETTDVRRPPRDTSNTHVKTCCELVAETSPRGSNITTPDQGTKSLASCPCAPQQINDILLTGRFLTLVKCACVFGGVDVSNLQVSTTVVAVVVEIVDAVLRLCFIEPEGLNAYSEISNISCERKVYSVLENRIRSRVKVMHAFGIIVLFCFLPHVLLCRWVRCVVVNGFSLVVHCDSYSSICPDEIAVLYHFLIVLRPDWFKFSMQHASIILMYHRKYNYFLSTVGHIDTISSIPISVSSRTIASRCN